MAAASRVRMCGHWAARMRMMVMVMMMVQNVGQQFDVCRPHEAAAAIRVQVLLLLLQLMLLLRKQLLFAGSLTMEATLATFAATSFATLRLQMGIGNRRRLRRWRCWRDR